MQTSATASKTTEAVKFETTTRNNNYETGLTDAAPTVDNIRNISVKYKTTSSKTEPITEKSSTENSKNTQKPEITTVESTGLTPDKVELIENEDDKTDSTTSYFRGTATKTNSTLKGLYFILY